ncbi:MAG: hypothetical protein WB868_12975, partial [Xanthobacteraceae bacterium]
MDFLKQINEFIPPASFAVVCIGGFIAILRFWIEGRRQSQIMADELYQKYLERAMDYPKLSWPADTIPSDERYPWLVAIMLNALAAQISCGPSADMRNALKADLLVHRKYLDDKQFEDDGGWRLYPPALRTLYHKAV